MPTAVLVWILFMGNLAEGSNKLFLLEAGILREKILIKLHDPYYTTGANISSIQMTSE